MPTKNFSGSLINYGTVLPPAGTTPDGALFFKVGGSDEGLYLFSFVGDTNLGDPLLNPSGQVWIPLTGTSSTIDADTLDGLDSTAFQTADPLLSSLSGLGTNGILVKDSAGTIITRSVVAGSSNRIAVSDGNGVGGNISLDVQQSNLDLNSIGGSHLSVSRGGTGNTIAVQGGVVYGASTTQYASSVVGTSGFLLRSNGTGAPSWLDPSSLTVGTANYANSAGTAGSATTAGSLSPGATIDIVGPTGVGSYFQATATTFTGASNIAISVTSINSNLLEDYIPTDLVLWNRIANMDTSSRTFTSAPAVGFTTIARPSLFYDMGSAGSASMTPGQFQFGSLSGFDAYSTSDIGQYQVGLTVMGTGGSGARALQLAGNWNFEEATPTGALRYRVNDDTTTVSAWGPWRTIVDTGSTIFGNYVLKSGDVMSGTLETTALAVGSISMPGTGSANFSGNVLAQGFVNGTNVNANGGNITCSTGGIIATGGYLQVGSTSGSFGYMRMQASGSVLNGILEFWGGNNVRSGYITSASTPASTDVGIITYVGASHAFTGNMTVTGNISADGNVTAYASSDGRLKKDIVTISGALEKVQALRGVDYTMKETGRRETGLIAQEVLQVVPEVVRAATDGTYGVAYGNLVGVLIEAIKEQQQQIDALRRQVQSLVK